MNQISTKNLFTKSIYEKLTAEEASRYNSLPFTERDLEEEQIIAMRSLGRIELNPSQSSIDIILDYSRRTSKLDTVS